jgi:hypothetical protein
MTRPDGGINLSMMGTATNPDNDGGDDGGNDNNGDSANEVPQITDGSIGALLFDVLLYIGNWTPDSIYIEQIPKGLYDTAKNLIEMINDEESEVETLLKYLIGENGFGAGDPGGGGEGVGVGEWVRVGATIDPGVVGQPQYDEGYNKMSYAELLVAGANSGLSDQSLGSILGLNQPPWVGMPMGTPLKIRMPGEGEGYTIYKTDNGSGQTGDPHYKIDLHDGIANKLGWTPNQDVEIRKVSTNGNGNGNN